MMGKTNKKCDAPCLDNINLSEDLECLSSYYAYRHTKYFHYSDINAINGILNESKIRVSSMMFSNDKKEHNCFGEETYRYFQLCFSCGTGENLPLWFLYSGRNGHGARISFLKSNIKNWFGDNIDKIGLQLCEVKTEKKTPIVVGKDCTVEFRDVLYMEEENGKYRIKHGGNLNNNVALEFAEKYKSQYRGFVKDIVWYYEKETRILIKVDENLLDKSMFYNVEKPK